MTESDTDLILRPDAPTENENYGAADFSKQVQGRSCMGWITVEPAMILTMLSVGMEGPQLTQYLWERISQDVGYNGSKTSHCSEGSSDPLLKEVQTRTAHWNIYITIVGFSLGLLTVPPLGSWSDGAGRRPVLLLSSVGLALQSTVYLLVMYLELPVVYLLVGRVFNGLCGDFNMYLASCFSYVADISDRQSRTFRVAILESCVGISGMLSGVIGGEWTRAHGVREPFWLVLACHLVSAAYVYWCVTETVEKDPSAKFFSFRHYKSIWNLLSTGGLSSHEAGRSRRHRLWLYMLCFFIVVTTFNGTVDLLVLYELSPPLCWDSSLIGIGTAAMYFASITSLLVLKLTESCLVESWMALLGLVSNISGQLIFSFAHTTAPMFTGYAVNLLSMTTSTVLESKMSQLAEPSQQGALFASVGFVRTLCFVASNCIFNPLYTATLHFMKGFTFLCAAIVLVIPTGIVGYLQWSEQRRDQ